MGFSPGSIRTSAFRRPANHSSSNGRLTFGLVVILALGFVVAAPNAGQAQAAPIGPVNLGTAAQFSVIGATTVTNVGTSTMAGDLGLYPGSSVTGFSTVPTGIGGTTHVTDAVALKAQNDVVIAYNDAAEQTPSVTGVGDLTGQTLTPGTYNGGELSVTGTLSLHGSAESVWVFQAASTLITASASRVEITGGASACNVFWKVGSSATLGAGSKFVGTILAHQSITAATGTTVDGRLLARTAAVTLDHTTIITSDACTESAASSSGGRTDSTTTGTTGTATGTDSTNSATTPDPNSPTSPGSTTHPTATPPGHTPPSAGGSVLMPGECSTAVRGTPYESDISTSIDGLPSTAGGGAGTGGGAGGSAGGSAGSGGGSGDADTTAEGAPIGGTPLDGNPGNHTEGNGTPGDRINESPVGGAPHSGNPADDTTANGSPGANTPSDSAPAARYEVVEGTLPPGLNLDSESGRISGTPTAADTYDLTVQVTEAPEHAAPEADASGSSGRPSHPTVSRTSESPGGDSTHKSSRTESSTGSAATGRSFITGSYVTGSVAKDLTYDFSITVVEPTTAAHHSQNGAPRTSVASSAVYPKMWTGSGSSRTHYAAGEQRPTMLAFTGADPLGAILLSLALVISGAALFIWRRRLVTSGSSSVR